jgi:AmmeMemoRadiSam system protein A
LGATSDQRAGGEVLSYEAPFGVGYLVAQITGKRHVARQHENRSTNEADANELLPRLAREVVETYVRTGQRLEPHIDHPYIAQRAACFVSLKTEEGELRGCIGTIEPAEQTLAEEIVSNAIGSATRDPRFPPVAQTELAELRYSVDVLSPAEPAQFEDLDPRVYGVIVEDASGLQRGLLLPDIEGVDTAEQQVQIAARKAGIRFESPLTLFRFRVERFREPF